MVSALETSLRDAWRSERLVYRAAEDNEEDKAFITNYITSDPVQAAFSSAGLLIPKTEKNVKGFISLLSSESIIGVIMCLPDDEKVKNENGNKEKAKS